MAVVAAMVKIEVELAMVPYQAIKALLRIL